MLMWLLLPGTQSYGNLMSFVMSFSPKLLIRKKSGYNEKLPGKRLIHEICMVWRSGRNERRRRMSREG